MSEIDTVRLAKLEQALTDHLATCDNAYGRNDDAHAAILVNLQKISNRLWALILALLTIALGAIMKLAQFI